jgi:L-rhamnonate dehydratase
LADGKIQPAGDARSGDDPGHQGRVWASLHGERPVAAFVSFVRGRGRADVKISDVEVIYLKIPQISEISNGTQDCAVILVHTDEGVTGIGEADTAPSVVGAVVNAPRSHSVMVGLREVLIGENPLDIERLWRKMYRASLYYGRRGVVVHAISGVDIALWDIKGKVHGRPVCELLGGSPQARVRAYASALFGRDREETAQKATMYKEAGFTAYKFGWMDFGRAEATDRAHVEGIRLAVGPGAPIMLDVGWAYDSGGDEWDLKTATRRAEMLAEYDVYWLEEPLPPDNMDDYGRLSERSPVRIAAGEQLSTIFDFRDLIERGKVDVLQPDVSRVGGITESMRIAALGYAHAKPVVPHHFSTGILGAASIHVNASIPNALFQETPAPGEGSILNTDLVIPPVKLDDDGCIVIPPGPGLGIELDPDVIDRFRTDVAVA